MDSEEDGVLLRDVQRAVKRADRLLTRHREAVMQRDLARTVQRTLRLAVGYSKMAGRSEREGYLGGHFVEEIMRHYARHRIRLSGFQRLLEPLDVAR